MLCLSRLRRFSIARRRRGCLTRVKGCRPALTPEQRDRLDVRGVREHVDDAGGREPVTAFVHEHGGVARERRRRARDIDDRASGAPSRAAAPSRAPPRLRAAGRSAPGRAGRAPRCFARRRVEQVGDREARARPARPLRRRFLGRRRTSAALPSTPTTCAPRRAMGSVKLPRPQKKSAIRSPGCGVEQRQRAAHQHAIDRRVHLRELGGTEWHRRPSNSGSV